MVTELVPVPNDGAVEELERLLVRFKTGELQEFMIVGIKNDGGTFSSWCADDNNAAKMIGEMMLSATAYANQSKGIPAGHIIY